MITRSGKFNRIEPHQNVMVKAIEAFEVKVNNEEGRKEDSTDLYFSTKEFSFKAQMMSSHIGSSSIQYNIFLRQSFEDTFLFVDDKVENACSA